MLQMLDKIMEILSIDEKLENILRQQSSGWWVCAFGGVGWLKLAQVYSTSANMSGFC